MKCFFIFIFDEMVRVHLHMPDSKFNFVDFSFRVINEHSDHRRSESKKFNSEWGINCGYL